MKARLCRPKRKSALSQSEGMLVLMDQAPELNKY